MKQLVEMEETGDRPAITLYPPISRQVARIRRSAQFPGNLLELASGLARMAKIGNLDSGVPVQRFQREQQSFYV